MVGQNADGDHAFKLIQNQLTPVGTNEGGGGTIIYLMHMHHSR